LVRLERKFRIVDQRVCRAERCASRCRDGARAGRQLVNTGARLDRGAARGTVLQIVDGKWGEYPSGAVLTTSTAIRTLQSGRLTEMPVATAMLEAMATETAMAGTAATQVAMGMATPTAMTSERRG
jgi:hypothetical protein